MLCLLINIISWVYFLRAAFDTQQLQVCLLWCTHAWLCTCIYVCMLWPCLNMHVWSPTVCGGQWARYTGCLWCSILAIRIGGNREVCSWFTPAVWDTLCTCRMSCTCVYVLKMCGCDCIFWYLPVCWNLHLHLRNDSVCVYAHNVHYSTSSQVLNVKHGAHGLWE